jgi:hypothetical protein
MQGSRKSPRRTGGGGKEVEIMTSRKPDHFGERASAGPWAVGTHVAGESSAPRVAVAVKPAPQPEAVAPRKALAIVAPALDFTAAMRRVEAEYYDAA